MQICQGPNRKRNSRINTSHDDNQSWFGNCVENMMLELKGHNMETIVKLW